MARMETPYSIMNVYICKECGEEYDTTHEMQAIYRGTDIYYKCECGALLGTNDTQWYCHVL